MKWIPLVGRVVRQGLYANPWLDSPPQRRKKAKNGQVIGNTKIGMFAVHDVYINIYIYIHIYIHIHIYIYKIIQIYVNMILILVYKYIIYSVH